MWVVAVLVGVWLFVAGPFWFWLVSSHPTLNSFKVTCASRRTQRPYPCQKKGSQFQSERPVTVIQSSQNEVVNQFLAGTSACDDIDQEVARFRSLFGGNTVDVKVCEGIADELTGHPISDRTGGRWSPNRDDTARRIAGGGHPCGESREEHCHRVWCSDLDFSLSVDTEEPC